MVEQLALPFESPASPESIFERAFKRLHKRSPVPTFRVNYRPWAQLRSTIRVRPDGIEVGVSDILKGVPEIALEALAEILLSRLCRRRPSQEARACYLACVLSPPIRQRAEELCRSRGFKRMLPPRGSYYNLDEIFDDLNHRFFSGKLVHGGMGWSLKRSRTILGHHDPAHRTITVSRLLDSARTPRFLIEYLVYHEMLHIHFPIARNHHRRVVHSHEFREAEKKFPGYDEALKLLRSGNSETGARGRKPKHPQAYDLQ
jgi:hypothetical protein